MPLKQPPPPNGQAYVFELGEESRLREGHHAVTREGQPRSLESRGHEYSRGEPAF